MVLLGGSAVLSGIIDNIPYVATMAPITQDLVQQMGGGADHVMWWALTLGADLGGNATAIGASANVVVLGIAERNRQPITFWQFTKYGLVVTAVTVAVSASTTSGCATSPSPDSPLAPTDLQNGHSSQSSAEYSSTRGGVRRFAGRRPAADRSNTSTRCLTLSWAHRHVSPW